MYTISKNNKFKLLRPITRDSPQLQQHDPLLCH